MTIVSERWYESFAWLPVRSTWSRKVIWFTKYHAYEYKFLKKEKICKNKFIYTKNEYIMTILHSGYEK